MSSLPVGLLVLTAVVLLLAWSIIAFADGAADAAFGVGDTNISRWLRFWPTHRLGFWLASKSKAGNS